MDSTDWLKQKPLYMCSQCWEDHTWPADDLHVHDGETWCQICWDLYLSMHSIISSIQGGIHDPEVTSFYDLLPFEPVPPKEVTP